jgi:hypothetical protein
VRRRRRWRAGRRAAREGGGRGSPRPSPPPPRPASAAALRATCGGRRARARWAKVCPVRLFSSVFMCSDPRRGPSRAVGGGREAGKACLPHCLRGATPLPLPRSGVPVEGGGKGFPFFARCFQRSACDGFPHSASWRSQLWCIIHARARVRAGGEPRRRNRAYAPLPLSHSASASPLPPRPSSAPRARRSRPSARGRCRSRSSRIR